MKYKLIHHEYTKEGYTYIRILTNLGIFEGEAFLHPEDEDVASEYAGGKCAEADALKKYISKQIKYINIKLQGLDDLRKLYNEKDMNNKEIIDFIDTQRFNLHEEKNKLKTYKYNIVNDLNEYLECRIKLLKKLGEQKRLNKKNNKCILNKLKEKFKNKD